jgi:HSP20 family protein
MMIRWTPFNELARLQGDLNRLFDGNFAPARKTGEDLARQIWHPTVDVVEDADKILVTADLPGVAQEQLEIQVEKDVLTLKGERKVDRNGSREHFRRYERAGGSFERSFTLPPTVDAEKIAASLKDGVLYLTLPKRPEEKPRSIKVSVA